MALGKQGGHASAPTAMAKTGKKNGGGVVKGGGIQKGVLPKGTSANSNKPR